MEDPELPEEALLLRLVDGGRLVEQRGHLRGAAVVLPSRLARHQVGGTGRGIESGAQHNLAFSPRGEDCFLLLPLPRSLALAGDATSVVGLSVLSSSSSSLVVVLRWTPRRRFGGGGRRCDAGEGWHSPRHGQGSALFNSFPLFPQALARVNFFFFAVHFVLSSM